MKRVIATAAWLLIISALASARNVGHQYRAQGYVFFGLGADLGDSSGRVLIAHVGGGGELFLYKGFGAGAEVGFASPGPALLSQAWIASGDLSYHFGRSARRGGVDPFVLIGPTGFFPASVGRGSPGANFGGGVNWWLGEHAALRTEFRDHVWYEFGHSLPGYLSFRIGVTFR